MYGLASRGAGTRYRMAVELHARGLRGFWYRLDGWHRYTGQTFATLAEVTQDPSCVAIQVSWGAPITAAEAATLAAWEGEDACPDCGTECRAWLRGERCGELLPPD